MQELAAGGPARLGVARYATEKLRVSLLVVGGATRSGPVERGAGATAGPEGRDGDVAARGKGRDGRGRAGHETGTCWTRDGDVPDTRRGRAGHETGTCRTRDGTCRTREGDVPDTSGAVRWSAGTRLSAQRAEAERSPDEVSAVYLCR